VPTIATRQDAFTVRSSETAGSRLGVDSLFVAVVHADDGVRFTATANSRRILVHRICEYVQEWGVHMLQPDHARHLRNLLARGEWEAAVELYFGLVGRRWDKEWLITAVVPASAHRDVVAVLGEVAVEEACTLRLDPGPRR
jgi:hypothetical protein